MAFAQPAEMFGCPDFGRTAWVPLPNLGASLVVSGKILHEPRAFHDCFLELMTFFRANADTKGFPDPACHGGAVQRKEKKVRADLCIKK